MDTRSHMCRGGWEVWVHGDAAIICMSMLIQLSYYACRNYMYTYAYPNVYIVCSIVQNVVYIV